MIVSNTSPLIAFSRIDRLDILQAFASEVILPAEVAAELRRGAHPREPILDVLNEGRWLEVRIVPKSAKLTMLEARLDLGEAEAIALASRLRCTLLVDERKARAAAARLKVDFVGTLGVVSFAKQTGLISAVRPTVDALWDAGIYYAPSLLDTFLERHNEL